MRRVLLLLMIFQIQRRALKTLFLPSLIGTMSFDDPDRDADLKIISELVTTLKNNCSHACEVHIVNLFDIG